MTETLLCLNLIISIIFNHSVLMSSLMYMLGIRISTDFYFMKVCHFVKHGQEIYFKNEKTAVSEHWAQGTLPGIVSLPSGKLTRL